MLVEIVYLSKSVAALAVCTFFYLMHICASLLDCVTDDL